ncbi:Haloacid dehalogenase [Candidatus Desulfarcum epimagneticum]|uniref:Haloacid dehalogenase n=1 Tax=uncultured Desulfobacteraceae bacterium TaxID=218296 RepID=A0A484HCV2_9BACT|nr:Haloacid dehalogenase [uncultured Desulfobacteraceae bacterium]
MIKPGAIAFDVDGVVADTMSLFLEIARSDHGINHMRYEDITCYDLNECLGMDEEVIEDIVVRITEGLYSLPLNPIRGSAETLGKIAAASGRLSFVTARPHPGPLSEWFRDVLPVGPDAIDLIATGSFDDKTDVLSKMGKTFFVEDRLETCETLKAAGIEPILFKQPWNRRTHPFLEVGSWKELEGLIDFS